MSKSLIVASALTLAMAFAALAAEEFFVAFDTSANQCRVMSTPPDGATMKKLASYGSLDEATEAMEVLPECKL